MDQLLAQLTVETVASITGYSFILDALSVANLFSIDIIGTKWVCPSCNNAYFAWWQDAHGGHGGVVLKGFVIDLSYYDTFDDEPTREPVDEPKHLCLDNAEDIQKVL